MKITIQFMTAALLILSANVAWGQGTITGTVKFEGNAPKLRPIKMDADPVCSAAHSSAVKPETVVVNANGTLKNVLISITEGLGDASFAVPEETVVLSQKGCLYDPHVWGTMAGQKVQIRNSDATLHNVHSQSKTNKVFNVAMPKVVKKKDIVFDKVEEPFSIKCDVHPWMRTWVGVFNHPFYAVTNDSGEFTIENVPAGTYTLRAWHESSKRLPAQTLTVTVADGGSATADYSFKPVKKK